MDNSEVLIPILVNTVVAIPIAILLLRFLFKGSVLFKIVSLWMINIVLIGNNTRLTIALADSYPRYISLPITIIISVTLIYLTYKLVRAPFDKALKDLEELSKGNLDIKYDWTKEKRDDELGRIDYSINSLSSILKNVASKIQDSSNFIAVSSNELSNIAQIVSQGASQQASYSEKISASIKEMYANISQNTENAKEAKNIAKETEEGIKHLGKSTNESLDSIRKIVEKVSIITDIAFQTNILAINAAIEASAAGQHGKGFAVVANEVKTLAEKSKLAAEEISLLAENSLNITGKTKEYMDNVLPKINKTLTLVDKIAEAGIEQNSGAEQINNAIQQLNAVTQQSAANSEEMAGNSEELAAHAEQLKELVAFFKFNKENM